MKMVIEINLDDLELDGDFKSTIRTRRNPFMVNDRLIYSAELDCPKIECGLRGNKWECYSGFYKECREYKR